ncbi:MAG: Smr/MutS family protein [Rhodospirillaceae bacterium]
MAKRPDPPGLRGARGRRGDQAPQGRPGDEAPQGRRSARPTPEEEALFHAAMTDTEPLPRRRRKPPAEDDAGTGAGTGEGAGSPAKAAAVKETFAPRLPAPPPLAPKTAPLAAGVAADLDRRTMDRLRKGRLRPEAVIDLHGMTAADAHRALGGFIGSAHATGRRCVLVITGKGSLKEGGGIIRRELPVWLNSAENRGRIIGFAQARPGDGGGGAFYVLLKRRRS